MARANIDWEAVEIQYRAGIRSLKDIGAEFGVSDAGILKRAKRDGWTRDLKAKIQAKADAKVSAALVSGEVSAQTRVAEAVVIDAESTQQAVVRLSQRKDIQRSRTLAMTLLEEVEDQTMRRELYENLGALMESPDENGRDKLNDLYMKVIGSSGRIDNMKKLADTLKTLVALEREAYGISSEGQNKGAGSLEDWLDSL